MLLSQVLSKGSLERCVFRRNFNVINEVEFPFLVERELLKAAKKYLKVRLDILLEKVLQLDNESILGWNFLLNEVG